MVFSSHIFLFYFLPLALAGYFLLPRSFRHPWLTVMSYIFYGWWNPPFVLLMLASTAIDYGCGKIITRPGASPASRKTGMILSIVSNLSILAFFKYTAMGLQSVDWLSTAFGGHPVEVPDFFRHIVLPLGISFYTFQSMSYSIDLYRGHARPAPSFMDFACYVSLFPQLVAGPIVRYGSIADQLVERPQTLPIFASGLARFGWGLAKKVLLADAMAPIADAAFEAGAGNLTPITAWLGVLAYALQIYFDFSAYSDMAIGLGRLFGFRFVENFNSPYKSASITEFWRRWHISLSSFLRDYLYIPLGGNRKGTARTYINLMLVMLIGGLWHGAAWTFVAWGGIHGVMLAWERLVARRGLFGSVPRPLKVALTFVIVLITWVFFRAESFDIAWRYLAAMAGLENLAPTAPLLAEQMLTDSRLLHLIAGSMIVFWAPNTQTILQRFTVTKGLFGLALLVLAIAVLMARGYSPFLYFQF
ncbi:MAG: MBOAT family protein [Verrucomicrobiales bacterium]|nr:MBOAT family protein [Verrucomicrobiales bacterium]